MRISSVEEAARDIVAAVAVQPALRMPLLDARGHVLSDDVLASVALPPWTNASMDGYAVRANDLRGASHDTPVTLRVIGSIAAGTVASRSLGAGEAARIFTGAPLPLGADSVVRQEDVVREGAAITVVNNRDAAANVRHAGGDLALGAVALAAGTVVGPHQIAVLAALAVAHPMVHRRPRVGILTSGDELAPLDRPDEIVAGRKLADVNTPAIAALVQQSGGIAVPLGIARDEPEELRRRIEAADDIDLLITAGGVSVGDHDHIRAVMSACQVRSVFDRVRVRPGGPTTFGIFPGGRPWLALPGNPVSAMVTFELFGRPAIRRMAGHCELFRRPMHAILRDAVQRDATLDQYLRVKFTWSDTGKSPIAELTGAQGSGMLMSLARADGLVIVPAGRDVLPARSNVAALHFD